MRTAVVTGGSSGIGYSIAAQLLTEGYRVLIGARGEAALYSARDRLSSLGDVVALRLDVCSSESVTSFYDFAAKELGRIDVLVNNAGIGGGGITHELPEEHWRALFETNVHGVYRCTMAFLKRRAADAQEDRIINIASTGGKQGVLHAAGYCATKHAVVGFTKALGLEWAQSGLTINAVCPGFVETDLAVGARERYAAIQGLSVSEVKARIEARVPIGRYIEPNEVARIVAFLAGPGSSGFTAQAINICGGLGNY